MPVTPRQRPRRRQRREPAPLEQLYTPAETCDLLKIGKTRLYELLNRGEISPTYVLGGKARRIPASAIARYLEGRRV